MASTISVQVWSGTKWVDIYIPKPDLITSGSDKTPADSNTSKIYLSTDSTIAKDSEKIYFNV